MEKERNQGKTKSARKEKKVKKNRKERKKRCEVVSNILHSSYKYTYILTSLSL